MKTHVSDTDELIGRKFIPELEGLRGLAILMVFVFHGWYLPGTSYMDWILKKISLAGWIGVDLFFVLSGYLITNILLNARESPSYFRNFYIRRSLRILPIYYITLSLLFVLVPLVTIANLGYVKHIFSYKLWFYSHTQNWLLFSKGSWPKVGYINHFWTLAIEWQFYLVWPWIVRYVRPKWLLSLCGLVIVSSFALRWSYHLSHPSYLKTYIGTLCRVDSFMFGAVLTLCFRSSELTRLVRRYGLMLMLAAGALIAWQFVSYKVLLVVGWTQTYGFSVIALFFAATIGVVLLQRDSWLGRSMDTSGLRFFGKYSYAIYLFHQPVIEIVNRDLGLVRVLRPLMPNVAVNVVSMSINLAITTALAVVSWHLIEKRFLVFWKSDRE